MRCEHIDHVQNMMHCGKCITWYDQSVSLTRSTVCTKVPSKHTLKQEPPVEYSKTTFPFHGSYHLDISSRASRASRSYCLRNFGGMSRTRSIWYSDAWHNRLPSLWIRQRRDSINIDYVDLVHIKQRVDKSQDCVVRSSVRPRFTQGLASIQFWGMLTLSCHSCQQTSSNLYE